MCVTDISASGAQDQRRRLSSSVACYSRQVKYWLLYLQVGEPLYTLCANPRLFNGRIHSAFDLRLTLTYLFSLTFSETQLTKTSLKLASSLREKDKEVEENCNYKFVYHSISDKLSFVILLNYWIRFIAIARTTERIKTEKCALASRHPFRGRTERDRDKL